MIDTCDCAYRASSRRGRRLRLPVAPRAQSGSRFGSAGSTRPAMLQHEALAWLTAMQAQGDPIETVEINGPGDPLALPEASMSTLRLVRQKYPDLVLSLATLGLGGDRQADTLAEIGVREVTVFVDAVEKEVATKLYAWIRPGTQTVPLPQAVTLLIQEQARAVIAFVRAGIEVTVQTTVHPGLNDNHVEQIAETMAGLGTKAICLTPFKPTDVNDEPGEADGELMARVQERAGRHLPIREKYFTEEPGSLLTCSSAGTTPSIRPTPSRDRPNVAVVSANGMEIDLHLGQAEKILVYGPRNDGLLSLLESRTIPTAGGGSGRWETLAASMPDCFALLVAEAGESPREIMSRLGIQILLVKGGVAETVERLYNGHQKKCRN